MPAFSLRLIAALLLLAGCSSDDEFDYSAANTGTGYTNDGGTAPNLEGASRGVNSSPQSGEAPVPGTQQDLELSVGDRVFFDYDSAVLSPVAAETLDRQGAWLAQYPDIVVTIEGHADERGTREYNLAIGDRRATAVKNYLVALNIDPERILTISYGEERPANAGNDEAAWAENRRAVTVVTTVN